MSDVLKSTWHSIERFVGWVFSPEWLPSGDFQLYDWLFGKGGAWGVVLLAFALAELVIPQEKRPWNRSTVLSSTYLLFTGKLTLFAVVLAPLWSKLWETFDLPSLHLDEKLPYWAYMPLALLVVTFVGYWAHRGMHRIPLCWHFHKVHHSARNLNWSSIYHRHALELLLHRPLELTAIMLLGTHLVAPLGIVFVAIDVLGHSNVRLDLGRLAYVISTPQAHRVHHSTDPRHFDRNFGNTFMVWDHVFGTFRYDPEHPPTAYGVDDSIPTSFVMQQLLPFAWIARDVRAWAARRVTRRDARAPEL